MIKASANGLGYLSLLADLGTKTRLRVWTDSTASRGMCARQGVGKVRHLDVQELWIQQRIRNGDFDLALLRGLALVAIEAELEVMPVAGI